jgi:acyl-homoserine lactone acylase PvdQ
VEIRVPRSAGGGLFILDQKSVLMNSLRRLIYLVLLIPIGSYSQKFTSQEISRYKKQAKNVTIIRDNWGIPHIYARPMQT